MAQDDRAPFQWRLEAEWMLRWPDRIPSAAVACSIVVSRIFLDKISAMSTYQAVW